MNDLSSIWTPHPKQAVFMACPVYEVMYGGAKGGGKSDVMLVDFTKQLAAADAAWRMTGLASKGQGILFRKEFGRLKDLIERAHRMFPQIDPGVRWKENDHAFTFSCGYRFEFGHLADPQDHMLYQGREFSWMGFDQVEEIPYAQYAYLKAQVRSSDDVMKPILAVRSTANPLGKYCDWVKRRFVDIDPAGFKIVTEKFTLHDGSVAERERVFIPALLWDNPSLPADYEASLRDLPDHMRRAFIDGDWSVTPGSFFGDVFDPAVHVIDAFDKRQVPSNWQVFRAGDWGSRAPACCLWIAADNDANLIVLEELYGPGIDSRTWGKKILEIEESWGWTEGNGVNLRSKLHGYIDPAAMSSHDGPSVAEKMFELGLSWFMADNERRPGWMEIRRRLKERGGAALRTPGLRICRNATNLIRTLPNLTAPDSVTDSTGAPMLNDADDIDTKQEDHAADALRYGVMSRPTGNMRTEDQEVARWERVLLASRSDNTDGRSPITGY